MKESSGKATEVNNELRLNVDEQPDDKKFKVISDMDDFFMKFKKSQLPESHEKEQACVCNM